MHVNADDPEACVEAARLAFAYRERFQRDFLIDLIGYRRYGHNEGRRAGVHAAVDVPEDRGAPDRARDLGAHAGRARRDPEPAPRTRSRKKYCDELQEALRRAAARSRTSSSRSPRRRRRARPPKAETAVPLERLREMNEALLDAAAGLHHPREARARAREARALLDNPDERTVDWAAAEELALASILADGISIRLTGEDVERGTFSHRHAVLHDAKTGELHVPLQALPQARAAFEIHNSPLTENALLGFEFGYNIQEPSRLVIWEAQYGDFINGAQTMIDEFIVSARGKWGLRPSLVFLLPHGHEGQGPDHASARPERFLQLAADINMRIANCTTAAQYFHLLRRQAALLQSIRCRSSC